MEDALPPSNFSYIDSKMRSFETFKFVAMILKQLITSKLNASSPL
jgi:hypothetical protein